MKTPAQGPMQEREIRCPVCKEAHIFVEGQIKITNQISFICNSPKCRGKRRYIKKELLEIIVAN